jgi:hypothetical protein
MDQCYSCGVPFDGTNNSEEHIINNSLGGRFKSRGLLCIECNGIFGSGIDRVMTEQLGHFTDLLGVKRQREKYNIKIPMKGKNGEIKYVGKKLKPHARLTIRLPDREQIVHYVPEDEFDEFVAKKKTELSKKYMITSENFYLEQPTKEAFKIQNSLSDDVYDIGFGGPEFFRSVTKMAVNYYLKLGYDVAWVSDAIRMICGEVNNEIAHFYYPKPIHYQIHQLGEDEVSHIIAIKGEPQQKMLYAYVELFSMQNVLIKLNMNYKGPKINSVYAFDLRTGKEIEKIITIKLGRHHYDILHLIGRENWDEKEKLYYRIEKLIEREQMT